ncbi:uncharacterized protein LOC108741769 isoform X2 [Agrilus planipennis]|uniref:Uncharacterized protein LOC108741769 isoform X2 n=1 Tax=Agrilus planipennis TaxID=224129 RepID=A0A7F5R418_AGRPL|nr:uncharacterized protein LOC108741769 isoform X2 [Agrilus planipennis]
MEIKNENIECQVVNENNEFEIKNDNGELEFKVLEQTSFMNEICNFNGLETSEDGYLCIITNVGLYMFRFRGYMGNFLKKNPSFAKSFLKPSEFSISDNLGINADGFVDSIPRYDLYEVLLRSDIYPKLKVSDKCQPISVKFSPRGLTSKTYCAVAVLTNFGSLEIFIRRVHVNYVEEFICLCNISQCLINLFMINWKNVDYNEPEAQLTELKKRVEMVTPISFTWSHLISIQDLSFCILVVGHEGALTFWKIISHESEIIENGLFLKRIEVPVGKITTLKWIQAEEDALLLVGDNLGKAIALCISDITEHSLSVSEEVMIYEQDFIKINSFQVFRNEGYMYLFIIKGIHLLIVVLNQDGKLVDKSVISVDGYQITGLEHYEKDLYFVLCYSGALIQFKINLENEKLKILKKYIHLKIDFSIRRAQGLYISPNRVYICIVAPLYKLINLRKNKGIIKVLTLKNCRKDPLQILLNNESGSICNYWDCLEVLRLNGLVEKKLPCFGLPQNVDYDLFSLTKLKTYLWLAKASEMIIDKVLFINEYNIKTFDDIKMILKIKLTVKHMEDLFELYNKNKTLTKFQMNSLYLHNLFLKDVVYDNRLEKLGLGENTFDSITVALTKSNCFEYPEVPTCFICEENILLSSSCRFILCI